MPRCTQSGQLYRTSQYCRLLVAVTLFACAPFSNGSASRNDVVARAKHGEGLVSSTALYKDCQALREDVPRPSTRIAVTWARSYDLIRAAIAANRGDFARRASHIDMNTRGRWPTVGKVSEYLALLRRSQIRIGNCPGNLTACTDLEIPPTNSLTVITVTVDLVENLCKYFDPESKLAKVRNIVSEPADDRAVSMGRIDSLVASAIIDDLKYATVRAFVLAHEATHVMLEPYSNPDFPDIYSEIRADIAAIQMTTEIAPEHLIDERALPLDEELRGNIQILVCHSGFGGFLSALENAGFADTFTGNLPARQRRETYEESLRRTHRCQPK